MPRKPRIHYPGAVYHVMLRGNGGQDIFFDSADRSRFLLLLQQGLQRYNHRVHAYCLMSNHVHLAVQVADTPLSKIMQVLGFRYTQFINWKRKRTGHLLQGRYKALLVDADSYLLELVRYIHLNPLRAGLTSDPGHYPWSSHGCYTGREKTPWLTTDWVLGRLDVVEDKARKGYLRFIQDGLSDGHRKEFHRGSFEGRVLGDDRFIERALAQAEQSLSRPLTMAEILKVVCNEYETDIQTLAAPGRHHPFAEARAAAAWLVRQAGDLQLKELAEILRRDLSGLSQAARRIEQRAGGDFALGKKLDKLKARTRKSVSQA